MAAPAPQPQPGDVLILGTTQSFSAYVVGRITRTGQQDFHGDLDQQYSSVRGTAEATARALVTPGRRLYFRNLDTGEWSELSD